VEKALHATEALHFFQVTCNTPMPGTTFGAEMGQVRREASALFSRSRLEFGCSRGAITGSCQNGSSVDRATTKAEALAGALLALIHLS
jgi:hypothetical protein